MGLVVISNEILIVGLVVLPPDVKQEASNHLIHNKGKSCYIVY